MVMLLTPASEQNLPPNVQSTSTGTHSRAGQQADERARMASSARRRIVFSLLDETAQPPSAFRPLKVRKGHTFLEPRALTEEVLRGTTAPDERQPQLRRNGDARRSDRDRRAAHPGALFGRFLDHHLPQGPASAA